MNRHDIEILGKVVAKQMGEGPSKGRIDAQREAVLTRFEEMQAASFSSRVPGLRWALAGVTLGLLAGVLWWRFAARPEGVHPERSARLSAEQVVQLPGGNEMRLAAGSLGSVREASPRQVRLSLERGTLISVVRTPVRWRVEAGPYYVEAAGTEYTVTWEDPRLEVTVSHGKVVVSRQTGTAAQWKVEAGGRLVLENEPEKRPTKTQGPAAGADAGDPPDSAPLQDGNAVAAPEHSGGASAERLNPDETPASEPPPARESEKARPASPPEKSRMPDEMAEWKKMLQAENYTAAVEIVERSGLAAFADTAPLADLQAMASAARYASKPQTALVLLVSMRTRFPGTPSASVAAFLMGRVYSEQLGDHRTAVAWFSTYLSEAPGGALAEEALGRRMDSAHRCGMREQAMESAKQLLARFPKSPFASLARKIAAAP